VTQKNIATMVNVRQDVVTMKVVQKMKCACMESVKLDVDTIINANQMNFVIMKLQSAEMDVLQMKAVN
jgi:hypothetical protein